MAAKAILRAMVRGWIRTGLWFRYRKVQIVFHSPLPLDGRAILAGNHQNAMLDSITLAACSPRAPFTLSRGSLFQGKISRWLLASLQMVPIYRFRDGFRRMRENPEVFQGFVDLLRDDEWLLIFPEGSHDLRYTLRPFQKGVARIAFAAQVDQDWSQDIPIYPVGLQYESHTTFGGRLLIQYGHPVSSLAYREVHSENPKEAERALTKELFKEMEGLLILPPQEDEAYEKALRRWSGNKGRFPDLMEQFRADENLMARELGAAAQAAGQESGGPSKEDPSESPVASSSRSGPSRPRPFVRTLKRVAGYTLSLPGVVLHLPVILLTLTLQRLLIKLSLIHI